MSRVALQFHADPEELVGELLPRWIGELRVTIAVEHNLGDCGRSEIDPTGLRSSVPSNEPVGRLFVSKSGFVGLDQDSVPFQRANPGLFVVTPGRLNTDGLRETLMGSDVRDADWKRLVARARRDLKQGAIAVDPMGGRHVDAAHYYSPGAMKLNATGVRMLAIAGSVTFELAEPEGPPKG